MLGPTRPTLTTLNGLAQRYQDEIYTLAYYLIGDEARAVQATEAAFEQVYHPELLADHFRLEVLRQVLRACRSRRVERSTSQDALCSRLLGLTPDEQAAVVIIDVLGLSYEQAAWIISCNQKQLMKLLAQARRHLGSQVAEEA